MYKIKEYVTRLKSLDELQVSWRHLNEFDLLIKLGEVPTYHNEFCIVAARIEIDSKRL